MDELVGYLWQHRGELGGGLYGEQPGCTLHMDLGPASERESRGRDGGEGRVPNKILVPFKIRARGAPHPRAISGSAAYLPLWVHHCSARRVSLRQRSHRLSQSSVPDSHEQVRAGRTRQHTAHMHTEAPSSWCDPYSRSHRLPPSDSIPLPDHRRGRGESNVALHLHASLTRLPTVPPRPIGSLPSITGQIRH